MTVEGTIAAVATGAGGALSVIRISGREAIAVCDAVFRAASGRKLSDQSGYTLHFGRIVAPETEKTIDEVLVSLFRAPRSYTGEDMAEISCHGSAYIRQEIMKRLIEAGARQAGPGEFTVRAFLNGKIDLSQAEAVADMIASSDRATHAMALNQMRGGYSQAFDTLREELLHLVSLLELELDFSEEDVTFADRGQLDALLGRIAGEVGTLLRSFSLGNAVKTGIGVAIVGPPNVGKSTLLNALLREDRAMVSEIAGTTRDVIEETVCIGGVHFRFIDTAGIRATDDTLEQMGIRRTFSSIGKARIILLLADGSEERGTLCRRIEESLSDIALRTGQRLYILLNKTDKTASGDPESLADSIGSRFGHPALAISAKENRNLDRLTDLLSRSIDTDPLYDGTPVVSNTRHYEALLHASEALARARQGLHAALPSDLLSQDIREVLYHLETITGKIATDDILSEIFSKFCVGK